MKTSETKLGVLVLLLTLPWPSSIHAAETLTNVDYMGLGYDVIAGNPHSDSYDKGFKRAVVKLSYTNGSLSSDQKWLIPDNMQALQVASCSYRAKSYEITEIHDYETSLSAEVQVGFGIPFLVKFKASSQYKQVYERTSKYCDAYIETVAKCTCYLVRAKTDQNSNLKVEVTHEFLEAVNSLPTKKSDQNYFSFISSYGTHYASEIVMGAKAGTQSEFTNEYWTEMNSKCFNFKLGAQLLFDVFTGGFDASNSYYVKTKDEFESKRSSSSSFFLGSKPSTDGKVETWAQTSCASPYPVEYILRSLTDLFTKTYIPNGNETALKIKSELFLDAVDRYCEYFKTCSVQDQVTTAAAPVTSPLTTKTAGTSTDSRTSVEGLIRYRKGATCPPSTPPDRPCRGLKPVCCYNLITILFLLKIVTDLKTNLV